MGTDSLLLRECLSFWKGYRFHDPEKEQQFHEWHLPDLLWYCQACDVVSLVFNLMPLIYLSDFCGALNMWVKPRTPLVRPLWREWLHGVRAVRTAMKPSHMFWFSPTNSSRFAT